MEFSKKDTSVIKGVAILFLVAYHCFSSVERFNGCDVSFYPFAQSTAVRIFESMNICVGMFAFLSSYGLTKTMKFKKSNLDLNSRENVNFVTKRVISLLGSFFIPYVLCTAATFIFTGYNPYGKGVSLICNIFMDMFGLAGLLHTPLLIGTWWYMSFALVIIFLIPFTVAMYRKFGILSIVPYAVLPVLFVPQFRSSGELTNMTRWLLTIPLGIIFADSDLLVKLKEKKLCRNKVISKIVKFVILTVILLCMFKLRNTGWGKEKFFYYISSILPVYFVYYLYEFVTDIPVLNTVLDFLGKHSSNVFFMHTFIRAIWFPKFTYSFKYAVLIFAFMIGASLLMSFAVEGIKKLIRWNKFIKFITDRLLKAENRIFYSEKAVS